MKTPHTMTARGRTVRVTLKSGETFEAKFIERTAKKILIFEGGRRVKQGDVKSFSDRRLLQPISSHRRFA
jgi:hypothetical protein